MSEIEKIDPETAPDLTLETEASQDIGELAVIAATDMLDLTPESIANGETQKLLESEAIKGIGASMRSALEHAVESKAGIRFKPGDTWQGPDSEETAMLELDEIQKSLLKTLGYDNAEYAFLSKDGSYISKTFYGRGTETITSLNVVRSGQRFADPLVSHTRFDGHEDGARLGQMNNENTRTENDRLSGSNEDAGALKVGSRSYIIATALISAIDSNQPKNPLFNHDRPKAA